MPLTCRKKNTVWNIYTLLSSPSIGVFSNSKLDEQVTEEFLNAIPAKFKYKEIN